MSSITSKTKGAVTTYHTSVVLEVQEDTVEALPGLGLPDDDGGVDLLAQLGLALLDGGHDHVTDTAGGQAVQAGADTLDGDDVQVAGTRVVGAVHDGTTAQRMLVGRVVLLQSQSLRAGGGSLSAASRLRGLNVHRETQGHLELATGGTTPVGTLSAGVQSSQNVLLCSSRSDNAATSSRSLDSSDFMCEN